MDPFYLIWKEADLIKDEYVASLKDFGIFDPSKRNK
jgi:hypothetical protein